MKLLRPTVLALTLSMIASSTALAGNIAGLRTNGNIAGLRTNGNIAGLRTNGNIGGMRTANVPAPTIAPPAASRFDLETTFSSTFAGLIRMLLESGALL